MHPQSIFDVNAFDQLFSTSSSHTAAKHTRKPSRTLDQLLDCPESHIAVSSLSSMTSTSGQPPTINRSLQVHTKTPRKQVDFQADLADAERDIYSTQMAVNDGTRTRRRMPAGQVKRTMQGLLQPPRSCNNSRIKKRACSNDRHRRRSQKHTDAHRRPRPIHLKKVHHTSSRKHKKTNKIN